VNRVNKDFGDVGGVGAGRIFTESYDVKAEGENAGKTKKKPKCKTFQRTPTPSYE